MKLHALNEALQEYGYPLEIESSDPNFHGHTRGVAICKCNDKGEVIENFMPGEDKDASLTKIINDNRITKLEKGVTVNEDGKLVRHTIYYISYYVVGHSVFQPTLNFENIIDDGFHTNYVDIELVFAYMGMCRYSTARIQTLNVSILDALYNSFDNNDTDKFIKTLGVRVQKEDEDGVQYVLDFYDEVGEMEEVGFQYPTDLRNAIVSVRMIDIKVEGVKND